jgi:hypothetical protein
MEQAFALNLFTDPGFSGSAVKPKSAEGISEGLFKSLLTKENRSTSSSRERGVEDDLGDTGMVPGMGSWAPGAEKKLTAYLEDKGIFGKEANSLIKGATGEDGSIHVDRLMAALNGRKGTAPGGHGDLMVASRDIPRLQEVLFRMGLGAGDVKALIERGGDGKGNVLLSKIVGTLSEKFPDIDSPQKLAALLSQLGIGCHSTRAAQHISPTDLKAFMHAYAETPSEDVQKQIKTVLAQVLREKGVPPEEVKSFLEGMNVTYAKKVSGSSSAKAGELGLWDGLVLRQQYKAKSDPWTEKILAILKDARTGGQQVSDKDGNFLQPFLFRGGDQVNLTDKSLSERLASLLRAGEGEPSSKRLRSLKGHGFDGKVSFASGEAFVKTAAQGSGANRVLPTSPHAGIFARALDYAQGTSPVPAILDRMQWMMKAGKQQARIQLSPPELGHIELRLVIDQGHLQAHLGTENPLVKEMIESNLSQLKQQLAGLGFVVEEFSVHVGADGRDFMDRDEMWGKTAKTGASGWTRETGIEPTALDQPDARTAVDDRYQINVRV